MKKTGAGILIAFFVMGTVSVNAQNPQQQQQKIPQLNQQKKQNTDVSDKNLKKFAKAYPKVQLENQKAQQKMVKVIQEDGMKLDRFNEIQRAKMQNKKVDVSDDEQAKLEKIKGSLNKMQPELQKKVQEAATSTGLSIQDFQRIASAIQSDTSLRNKFKTAMSAEMKNKKK